MGLAMEDENENVYMVFGCEKKIEKEREKKKCSSKQQHIILFQFPLQHITHALVRIQFADSRVKRVGSLTMPIRLDRRRRRRILFHFSLSSLCLVFSLVSHSKSGACIIRYYSQLVTY